MFYISMHHFRFHTLMSISNNKQTTSFGNSKEIKNALYSLFFYYMCIRQVTTHLSLTFCDNHIASRLVDFRGTEIDDVCTYTQTALPIILLHYIFTHTHMQTRLFTEYIITLPTKYHLPLFFFTFIYQISSNKNIQDKNSVVFLTYVVLNQGSLIHPHTPI
jgi:hypothetical protein